MRAALIVVVSFGVSPFLSSLSRGDEPAIRTGLHRVAAHFCRNFVEETWSRRETDIEVDRADLPRAALIIRGTAISSDDTGGEWLVWPYGPFDLALEVELSPLTAVEFVWDGKTYDRLRVGDDRSWSIVCPGLGRHVLQARYLIAGLGWSPLTPPLRLDIVTPLRPKILGVGDGGSHPEPLQSGVVPQIRSNQLRVLLADVVPGSTVVAYLDDQRLPDESICPRTCCVVVDIGGRLTTGVHTLTVRVAATPSKGAIASEPSEPVRFHYQIDAILRLEPGSPKAKVLAAPAATTDEPKGPAPEGPRPEKSKFEQSWGGVWQFLGGQAASTVPKVRTLVQDTMHEPQQAREILKEFGRSVGKDWQTTISDSTSNRFGQPDPFPPESTTEFAFSAPAHFPLREFGARGEPLDRDGLIIYEGMKLRVADGGRFEVVFRTNSPRLPVTLRLQLHLQMANGNWQTITLKPIEIDTNRNVGLVNDDETTGDITRRGRVPVPREFSSDDIKQVRRAGTARLGHPVTNANFERP